MANFSLHAYDADVWIREFKGINQGEEGLNPDLDYAAEAVNMETPGGVLQPHAGYRVTDSRGVFAENRVETLAHFHRRWSNADVKEWMVCAAGGQLYAAAVEENPVWFRITLPEGVDAYAKNTWSWVTYELNEEGHDTLDVLLLSNDEDGMIMVIPPDRRNIWQDAITQSLTWANPNNYTWGKEYSEEWNIRPVDTEGYKFGVIERYSERIWGGNVKDNPDMLVYSRPYNVEDWSPPGPDEQPEDGGGTIQVPSWDGDSFTSLKAFGDQLLALKEHRIWRVMGTNPGEFVVKEQFGDGAPFPNTVCVDVERVFMADEDGISVYDGMSVMPFMQDLYKKIWRTVNRSAMDQMCAALFNHRYYLAFPVNGSTTNNAVLVYNFDDRTMLYYTDLHVESFLPTNETLYATTSTLPGEILEVKYDSWLAGKASGAATRWESQWLDFGYKRIVKGGFEFYFLPEVQDEAVTLKISIETEKKIKTKTYTVNPSDREHRNKRLHFGGSGRRFRVIIETEAGVTAPWRLIGGVQMVVETDPD